MELLLLLLLRNADRDLPDAAIMEQQGEVWPQAHVPSEQLVFG